MKSAKNIEDALEDYAFMSCSINRSNQAVTPSFPVEIQ